MNEQSIAELLALVREHIAKDDERFKKLDEIGVDVKSLLGSRSFARGALWLAGGISAVVSMGIAYLKH